MYVRIVVIVLIIIILNNITILVQIHKRVKGIKGTLFQISFHLIKIHSDLM